MIHVHTSSGECASGLESWPREQIIVEGRAPREPALSEVEGFCRAGYADARRTTALTCHHAIGEHFVSSENFRIFKAQRGNELARTAIVTLTTDFGLNDHFVGAMKGVILEIAPEAQIIDISHAVQPFDILDGALTISQAQLHLPFCICVHMVIVDPEWGWRGGP